LYSEFLDTHICTVSHDQIGAFMAVIVWKLDLQLHVPLQSVHITIDVVSSNPNQSEVYNIMR
jgi:hypothetical protein